jgi:hypothetical protein
MKPLINKKSPQAETYGLYPLLPSVDILLLAIGSRRSMRLGRRLRNRPIATRRVSRNTLPLFNRHAVAKPAATARTSGRSAAATRATASAASRIVAATVARIPTIRRIAVEITVVTLTATSAAPCARHEQRKNTTQRTAMPRTATSTWVAARIAIRVARRTPAARAASTITTVARRTRSTRQAVTTPATRAACRTAGIAAAVACRNAIASHGTRAVAKNRLK